MSLTMAIEHVAIWVRDLERMRLFYVEKLGAKSGARYENAGTLVSRLANQGVVVAGRPRLTGDGYYEAVIEDPEGNRVELVA
jgi:catechol 2,3-dioxygenase-like lactoylglutathione lyase family enzyme